MADDITNDMLLQHMQGMKYDLEVKMDDVSRGFLKKVEGLSQKLERHSQRVEEGFEEAHQHRQALQEDLEATILMQAKHQAKLARL